jgi:hypothetical protein
MGRSHLSQLVVFSALPFLLLSSARTTSVRTTVYLDGTVQRQLQAGYLQDRQDAVLPQLQEALPHADRETVVAVADGQEATRSLILANADDLDGVYLEFLDIAQEPLSLFTHYTYKETLTVPADTATAVEKAGLDQAAFEYRVTMPGRVLSATATPGRALAKVSPAPAGAKPPTATPPTPSATPPTPATGPAPTYAPPAPPPATESSPPPASATPEAATPEASAPPPTAPAAAPVAPAPVAPAPEAAATPPEASAPAAALAAPTAGPPTGPPQDAELSGSSATWKLTAAHDQYEITVTSRRWRWGYFLTLLYLLAFVAYRLTDYLLHRASLKPKRI